MSEVNEQILDIFNKDRSYFELVEWTSFHNKYDDQELCFKDKLWNFPVTDLSDGTLTDNNAERKKFVPFYSWLGERIELCLNLNRGKTNEILRKELNEQGRVL